MTSLAGAPAPHAPDRSAERRWDPVEGGAGGLAKQVDALAAFVRAAEPYLPSHRLETARELANRATRRLSLPLTFTVVALAGATGGGKSSLFNALAGANLSPVGVRRPTTGDVYAAVFGRPEAAADLLDWLKVQPARRFAREGAVVDDGDGLSGLVLLDLPDFDSVERGHAAEVERLLRMVDVVVWVVDPQKYADHVLHERHLSRRGPYRDVTLVVLNQADLLRDSDLERLLGHLKDLLVADGLDPSTAVATSAIGGAAGTAALREWLARVVASRRAPLQRLAADLSEVVAEVSDLVAAPPATAQLDTVVAGELAGGMAQVAAAPAVIAALEHRYRTRAAHAVSPPLLRWIRDRRTDGAPAHPDDASPEPDAAAAGGGVTPGPAARAAADLVVRRVAARATEGLPDPWPEVAAAAALTDLDELVERVGRAVGRVRPELDHRPRWWQVFAAGQWLAAAAVVAGAIWYAAGGFLGMVGLPTTYPAVGPLPAPAVLVAGGLAAMAILTVAGTQLARWHARRLGTQAAARLRAAINDLGRAHVLAPLRAVLRAYGYARDALAEAAGR